MADLSALRLPSNVVGDTIYGVFREEARLLSVTALPDERLLQRVPPRIQSNPDSLREEISGVGDSQREYFAVSSSIAVMAASASVPSRRGVDGILEHCSIPAPSPPSHSEEVVQTALAKAGGLADQGKVCTFVSMFAKYFGQGGDGVGSFSDHAGHD
ncbi:MULTISPECIES: hypothetical protein [Rhizobium]|uniref:hypothetical protein n=1 Tax=Rhizobium TaxID=379 RepID=UPI00300C3FD9